VKRLLRILLNGATVLSLALCTATVLMWARETEWLLASGPSVHALTQREGRFRFASVRFHEWSPVLGGVSAYYAAFGARTVTDGRLDDASARRLGVDLLWLDDIEVQERYGQEHRSEPARALFVTAPPWMPIAALGLLPAVRLSLAGGRTLRHRRRSARGLCPACGYDLRATPDRCPECGRPADRA
jgi:hypothetical protein